MRIPTLQDIEDAAGLLAGEVLRTPFLPSARLSALTGAEVFVKYESLQATSSFKERGARVKLLSLDAAERAGGVIAMSAGNHAQAVAFHARKLGIAATIVMPRFTPFVKIAATRSFGANVVLEGDTLADCAAVVDRLRASSGATLVHPYDDFDIIRGQGTIGLEIAHDGPDLDFLTVPVGGGGLIGGIAIAMKALKPATRIVGVETELYPSLHAALRGAEAHCGGESLAEGIAVKSVGALSLEIARHFVDDVQLVSEAQIERAIACFLILQNAMAEGAGAAGLAALLAAPDTFAGRKVGVILAGGNIDPHLASSIVVRELVREERIVPVRITIPDRPGVLAAVARTIAEADGNILDVAHHRASLKVPPKGAIIDVTIETHGPEHALEIVTALKNAGFRVKRLDAI